MDYSPSSLPVQQKEVCVSSSTSTTTPSPSPALVDPFLKEALQNPRHRLTILRMELDIQSFMQNHDQQLFEFPHFPTSYLRLAAHRVAQHYGLQSMVVDNVVDGLRTKIVVKKTTESKRPAVCLSEVPAEQLENDKPEQVKIAIKQRSQNAALNGANAGTKHSTLKTMEERKEEYDRARARIFKSSNSPDSGDASSHVLLEERSFCLSRDTTDGCRSFINEPEKIPISRDGNTSRVAIFRDREKDRTDPDYDRSYERYVRGLPPNQSFSLGPYNAQIFQPSFVQYEAGIPQHGVLPRTQVSLSYRPSNPIMSPFCSVGLNQTSGDSLYTQCPSLALMYTQSYEQVRHAVFQAPFYHQPLSFDYSQNY
ncbi:Single-stranded nucleic acid binding r3h protein [Thalictrum thalictroides]|uniref:Single-stranded nucleic acid binding r3h protein n=1 Tax=Thalictrum thalictroides TaxID=46969 RepID=A0A7J6WIV6_THATH|nr:Single-stranded nucleic acid binding r3h protein [Thalictrum thalictroides]